MSNIHEVGTFAGLDLDALIALDVLLHTGSVTRSAALRGVTQSAMSHTLRKLRSRLDDALLVRQGGRMEPTPRAEALRVPLRSALLALDRALDSGSEFEPSVSRRAFRMASPDLFDAVFLPAVLGALHDRAPSVDLALLPVAFHEVEGRLQAGELDIAVTPFFGDPGVGATDLVRRTLFTDTSAVFARADHPVCRSDQLDLEAYLACAHAMVSPTGRGGGYVDSVLAQLGQTRRVALRLPSFLTALGIVGQSDLLLTAPAGLRLLAGPAVRTCTPPVQIPEHRLGLSWPRRLQDDPGHRWFRTLIVDVVAEARTATTR